MSKFEEQLSKLRNVKNQDATPKATLKDLESSSERQRRSGEVAYDFGWIRAEWVKKLS
jgi:hypothetical protein